MNDAELQQMRADFEAKLFRSIEELHEKHDKASRLHAEYASNVQKYANTVAEMHAKLNAMNDDILEMKDRENRHGRKIKRIADVVFPRGGAPAPAWGPPPMRAPAPSRPDWDPEDTSPHILPPADIVRLGEIADRDRKESLFYRGLPRAAGLKALGYASAALISASIGAAFAWLLSHR